MEFHFGEQGDEGLRPREPSPPGPVSYMSPRNRAPKSANFSILNSLSTLPETPLPHPLGCLANCPENRGEESPAGHSPDHPPDNRENHRDDSPADYREDNLPESVEDNLDRSLDSRSADYSADCLENHPESNLGDNPEDNPEDNGENNLPDDSADRSSRSWADSCSDSYPSTSLRPRAGPNSRRIRESPVATGPCPPALLPLAEATRVQPVAETTVLF